MAFTKDNQPKNRKPRGKGKKTLLREAMSKLELSGINVYGTYKILIDELVNKKDKTEADYSNIINILDKLQDYNDIKAIEQTQIQLLNIANKKEDVEVSIDTDIINISSTQELLAQFQEARDNE